jgi:hypothetical protein
VKEKKEKKREKSIVFLYVGDSTTARATSPVPIRIAWNAYDMPDHLPDIIRIHSLSEHQDSRS